MQTPIPKSLVEMRLSQPEVKLILRLRQLRKLDTTQMVLLVTRPLTISLIGPLEVLDNPADRLPDEHNA